MEFYKSERRGLSRLYWPWLAFVALFALPLPAQSQSGPGFPNQPQTKGELLSGPLAPNQGRTASIAYHQGFIVTTPESPGSAPGSDQLSRAWDISNPRNVEKTVVDVEGIKLYNIDDLKMIADKNKAQREQSITEAKKILEDHPKVIFGYLFGGLAKGYISSLSDVDIAVYLTENDVGLEIKMDLLRQLGEVLKTDEVDLVILNTASLPLKARIIKNKKVLVDKDPPLRYSFESLILREYFDFSVKEKEILYRRHKIG